ncbi:hypothetical protein HK101_010784 [Irineochytrium annulatum]|nr:hypothetical protein HK101_010784 [Irineochytrium annulatum]
MGSIRSTDCSIALRYSHIDAGFGYHSASAIDALLDKEGLTLDELIEEEELLQECKAHNAKLVEFLCKPNVLAQLINYIVADDLDETKKFKYPYVACEVLSCEIFALCEAAISNNELMVNFWKILDKEPPLNPLQASYFSKVNNVFFQKKTGDMVVFVKSQTHVIDKILMHIGTSAIADLLLKIISVDEVPEGQDLNVCQWLSSQNLISNLIDRLSPAQDVDIHNTASQTLLDIIAVSYQSIGPDAMQGFISEGMSLSGGNLLVDELKSEAVMGKLVDFMLDKNSKNSTSTLTNGINIIIELIRRYCSEIEQAEYQQHQYQTQLPPQQRLGPPIPSDEKLCALAMDLNFLLRIIGSRLPEFAWLLENPRNMRQQDEVDTTLGRQIPLGSERLKTCELFAEVLHLQYLYSSSPLFERLIPKSQLNTTKSALASLQSGDPSVSEMQASTDIVGDEPLAKIADSGDASAGGAGEASFTGALGVVEGSAGSVAGAQAGASAELSFTVSDELASVTDRFVQSNVLPMCLELFFKYPWNNFLHSVVYDMIAKVFNTYSFTSTANLRPQSADLEGGFMSTPLTPAEVRMKTVKDSVFNLVVSILLDGRLTDRITAAQKENDAVVSQPKGVRLGYMGHLTYIADEVCKLMEKCSADFNEPIRDLIYKTEWQEYLTGVLRETKERDRQPLGGARPVMGGQAMNMPMVSGLGAFGANIDDSDIGMAGGMKKELGLGPNLLLGGGVGGIGDRADDDEEGGGPSAAVIGDDIENEMVGAHHKREPDAWPEANYD